MQLDDDAVRIEFLDLEVCTVQGVCRTYELPDDDTDTRPFLEVFGPRVAPRRVALPGSYDPVFDPTSASLLCDGIPR